MGNRQKMRSASPLAWRLFAVLLGLVNSVGSQAATPDGASGGSIAGTILDSTRMVGVPGVMVGIFDAQGNEVAYAYSGLDGRYTSSDLQPGVYFLAAGSLGFVYEVYDDQPCGSMTQPVPCVPTSGVPVTVESGATTAAIDFDLTPKVGIHGRVTDAATGEPLRDVLIQFWTLQWNPGGLAFTDEYGQYFIWVPGAGDYFVNTQMPGYIGEIYDDHPCLPGCNGASVDVVSVAADHGTTGIDFALDHVGAVAGTITDKISGDPVASAEVQLLSLAGVVLQTASSRADGRYVLSGAEPGAYRVRTSKEGFAASLYPDILCPEPIASACPIGQGNVVNVPATGFVGGIDLSIEFVAFGIEGRLRDAASGQPLASKYVEAWAPGNQWLGRAYTDAYGNYRIGPISTPASGPYLVYTDAGPDWIDEVFNNIACPWNPLATISTCRGIVGAAVQASPRGPPARHIDFDLEPSSGLFVGGFEN